MFSAHKCFEHSLEALKMHLYVEFFWPIFKYKSIIFYTVYIILQVSSAVTHFENMNVFPSDWYIRKGLVSSETIDKHRELHSTGTSSMGMHKTQHHTHQSLPSLWSYYESVPSTAAFTTSLLISENPASTTPQWLTSCSASRLYFCLHSSGLFQV